MTALVAVASGYEVGVVDFPVDPAERRSDRSDAAFRRAVELRAASHDEAGAIAALLDGQQAPYRPVRTDVHADGALTVTYAPAVLG
jgi:hypothetical protein